MSKLTKQDLEDFRISEEDSWRWFWDEEGYLTEIVGGKKALDLLRSHPNPDYRDAPKAELHFRIDPETGYQTIFTVKTDEP